MQYGRMYHFLNVQNIHTFVLDGRQTSVVLPVSTSLKTGLSMEAEQTGRAMGPCMRRRLTCMRNQRIRHHRSASTEVLISYRRSPNNPHPPHLLPPIRHFTIFHANLLLLPAAFGRTLTIDLGPLKSTRVCQLAFDLCYSKYVG